MLVITICNLQQVVGFSCERSLLLLLEYVGTMPNNSRTLWYYLCQLLNLHILQHDVVENAKFPKYLFLPTTLEPHLFVYIILEPNVIK